LAIVSALVIYSARGDDIDIAAPATQPAAVATTYPAGVDEAIATAREAVRQAGEASPFSDWGYVRPEAYAKARSDYTRALEMLDSQRSPDSSRLVVIKAEYGWLLCKTTNPESGEKMLADALALEPGNRSVLLRVATVRLRGLDHGENKDLKQWQTMHDTLDRLIAMAPDLPEPYYLRALAASTLGKREKMLGNYKSFIANRERADRLFWLYDEKRMNDMFDVVQKIIDSGALQ